MFVPRLVWIMTLKSKVLLHFKQGFEIGFVNRFFAFPFAGDIVFQKFHSEHGDRFAYGRDLGDHRKTILLFLYHAPHTFELTLYPRDARENR